MVIQKVNLNVESGGIATITLNNPGKHNAFDDEMIAALTQYFDQVNADDSVRVLVLAANGRSFSAGADLAWMKRMAEYGYDENLADAQKLAAMLQTLNTLTKPTIAKVQGATFGGGVGLVSCCDIAVASNHASFCLSEVKIGLAPATISPYVVQAMGSRAARRYCTTAERFDAATALRIGLISELVTADELDTTVNMIANAICNNGPAAVTAAKHLIRDVQNQTIDANLMQQTSELIATLRSSIEGKEGLAAFLDKRPASWLNQQPTSDE